MSVGILGIYGYLEYNREAPNSHSLKPAFQLKAPELIRQFETDEPTADARFVDKPISVSGIIGVVKSTDSSASVFLIGKDNVASVICQFDRNHKEEVKDLKRGDTVTVKGICTGYLMDVIIVRCVVDK